MGGAGRLLAACLLASCLWGTGRAATGRAGLYMAFDPIPVLQGVNIDSLDREDYMQGPQFTLPIGQSRGLLISTFSMEALIRIRDPRLFDDNVPKPTGVRVPIMGNYVLHRGSGVTDPKGAGYGIGCTKAVGQPPECCLDVWVNDNSGGAVPEKLSVCTGVGWAAQGEWFHLSAGFGEQSEKMWIQTIRQSEGRTYVEQFTGGPRTINFLRNGDQTTWPPFRVGHYMEVDATGKLFFAAESFPVYFQGDVDELAVFKDPRTGASHNNRAFEIHERGVGGGFPEPGLGVYVPVRDCLASVNPVAVSPCDATYMLDDLVSPGFGTGSINVTVTAPERLSYSVSNNVGVLSQVPDRAVGLTGLAVNLTLASPPTASCGGVAEQDYPPTCGTNYLDRRARVVTGPTSVNAEMGGAVSFAGLEHQLVVLGQHGPAVADLFVYDQNLQDTVRLDPAGGSFRAYLQPRLDTWGDPPKDYFDLGLPFALSQSQAPVLAGADYRLIELPEGVVRRVPVTSSTPRPQEAVSCGLCSASGDCNCAIVRVEFVSAGNASQCNTGLAGDAALHRLCTEWYVPPGVGGQRGGWQIVFTYTEVATLPSQAATGDYSGHTPPLQGLGDNRPMLNADVQVRALVRYEASPEWFSRTEYPLFIAARETSPGVNLAVFQGVYFSEAKTPYEGKRLAARAGVAVSDSDVAGAGIEVLVRDRNIDDYVDIVSMDDPGMPNGAELSPPAFGAGGSRCHAKVHDIVLPNGQLLYKKTFRWVPGAGQTGSHRVCFEAVSYPREAVSEAKRANVIQQEDDYYCCSSSWCPFGPGAFDASVYPPGTQRTRTPRCFVIDVLPPKPDFDPPVGGAFLNPENNADLNFRAGCTESIYFAVKDTGVGSATFAYDRAPLPYDVKVILDGGSPPDDLAVLGPLGPDECHPASGEGTACYALRWKAKLSSSEGYEACFAAVDVAGVTQGADMKRRCYRIRVKKCQYCVSEGETFASVGADFGIDWLLMYMANPTVRNPDTLPPGTVVNLGVVYEVRPGDYLELIAQKFHTTVPALQTLNTDVTVEGIIQPGMEICVMPPVCDVKCLYGTDCHIY